jgi:uncharacterized protein (DUF2141 family)
MAQNTLTVEITGLRTNSGTVMIQLYDANQKLLKETTGNVAVSMCTVVFNDIPSGTYAVQYYHDENDNDEMDTGMFGKPEEGYGYSNDARGFMGPADFEDQLFEINKDLKISLETVL